METTQIRAESPRECATEATTRRTASLRVGAGLEDGKKLKTGRKNKEIKACVSTCACENARRLRHARFRPQPACAHTARVRTGVRVDVRVGTRENKA